MKQAILSSIITVALMLALATVVTAAVPQMISYQGRLTDAGGPVTATVAMTFTIYDAVTVGNSKWTETHPSVSVVDGLFNVVLGAGTPAVPINDTVFSGQDRWLEITVGGETITPRTKLASNPYAFNSNWLRIGSVLYTSGVSGIAKAGNTLGGLAFSHVNLGHNSSTDGYGSTVGGGGGNQAIGGQSTVGGGESNTSSGDWATVGGGVANTASGERATVGGGSGNTASGYYSTVGGGRVDSANGQFSTVGGGSGNTASGSYSTVGGGISNRAAGDSSTVGGGSFNTADGDHATVSGGHGNLASGQGCTVGGGDSNKATWYYATVSGGESNEASAWLSTVGGGLSNTASGVVSAVGGGVDNLASGDSSTVAGGTRNHAIGAAATVGGGFADTANGYNSTVSGGFHNSAIGDGSTAGGGWWNVAGGSGSTIAGGQDNTASGNYSAIGGGSGNTASGSYSTIPGGELCEAGGDYSFAAGFKAKALHYGSFVWADSTDADFTSTGGNQFLIRADGGVGIGTNDPSVALHVVGSICYTTGIGACSDARYKKDIETISGALGKVGKLRGVSFNWRHEEYPEQKFSNTPQLGLIAQEVKQIFPEVIMQDHDGYYSVDYVKLTPILVEAIKELKAENDAKEARINDLQAQITQLTALVEVVLANQQKASGNGRIVGQNPTRFCHPEVELLKSSALQ